MSDVNVSMLKDGGRVRLKEEGAIAGIVHANVTACDGCVLSKSDAALCVDDEVLKRGDRAESGLRGRDSHRLGRGRLVIARTAAPGDDGGADGDSESSGRGEAATHCRRLGRT
jgi:hypothetical protein